MLKMVFMISLVLSIICLEAFAQEISSAPPQAVSPKKETPLTRDFRDQSQQGLKLTNEVIAQYKAQHFSKASH